MGQRQGLQPGGGAGYPVGMPGDPRRLRRAHGARCQREHLTSEATGMSGSWGQGSGRAPAVSRLRGRGGPGGDSPLFAAQEGNVSS